MAIINRTYGYDHILGSYSIDEIAMCKGQKAVTFSGAEIIINGTQDNLVNCMYIDASGYPTGFSWIGHQNIHTIPWLETFKGTKMGKVILL